MKNSLISVLGLGILSVLGACGGGGEGTGTQDLGDPQVKAGRQLFLQKTCASCHGETGQADTPLAANLTPKPRDYSDGAWQDSVTDEHIRKVIREGGSSVGLSNLMPPNGSLSDQELGDLVAFIRSLRAE